MHLLSFDGQICGRLVEKKVHVHLWIPCLAPILDRVNIVHLSVKIEMFIILFSTTVLETDTIR